MIVQLFHSNLQNGSDLSATDDDSLVYFAEISNYYKEILVNLVNINKLLVSNSCFYIKSA
jgi:hypothetical protein